MLNEHTLDQLRTLRLDGMVHALQDQAASVASAELAFPNVRFSRSSACWTGWRDVPKVFASSSCTMWAPDGSAPSHMASISAA